MIDLKLLKQHPELAKDLNASINLQDLFNYSDHLIKRTTKEVEERIQAASKVDKLLTAQEVSELLNTTLTTLWRWNKDGILTNLKIGSKIRYKESVIRDFINQKGGEE